MTRQYDPDFQDRQIASDMACECYRRGDFELGDRLDALIRRSQNGDREASERMRRLQDRYSEELLG